MPSYNESLRGLSRRVQRRDTCLERALVMGSTVRNLHIRREATVLILTRKLGEVLHIGDDIKVTVLNVKGNQVRLGIDAPKDVSVHREEVYERIRTEDQRSS